MHLHCIWWTIATTFVEQLLLPLWIQCYKVFMRLCVVRSFKCSTLTLKVKIYNFKPLKLQQKFLPNLWHGNLMHFDATTLMWTWIASVHYIGGIVVRIHIVIQHTSLTYHTHIHTQTHNMDKSIHKYLCTTIENVTRKIYYHKTHDANTYSQAKPTPLRESRPMLTWHHSLELHWKCHEKDLLS
jgi:hypothetical protein